MGPDVGLSDGVSWFTSSFGGMRVGADTGSLADSLGVFHELNTTVCSIMGDPDICSMVTIEYLAWVDPLDE